MSKDIWYTLVYLFSMGLLSVLALGTSKMAGYEVSTLGGTVLVVLLPALAYLAMKIVEGSEKHV